MARQRSTARPQQPIPSIPMEEIPDGGSVTFTVGKEIHRPSADEPAVAYTAADLEDGAWLVEREKAGRWVTVETTRGRPYAPDIIRRGPGVYRTTPLHPETRKPIYDIEVELIEIEDTTHPVGRMIPDAAPPSYAPAPTGYAAPAGYPPPVDPWQAMIMEENRRRADREEKERERDIQDRKDRQAREDRDRQDRLDREKADREAANSRWERIIGLATSPLGAKVIEGFLTPKKPDDEMTRLVIGLANKKSDPPPDPMDQLMRFKVKRLAMRELAELEEDDDDKEDGDITPKEVMRFATDAVPQVVRAIKGQPEPAPATGNPLHDPERLKGAIIEDPEKALTTISALVQQHPEYADMLKKTVDHGLQAAGKGGRRLKVADE